MKFIAILFGVIAMAMADFEANNNRFSTQMFQELVKSQPDKSVIVSGFSVLPLLAQLSLASEGNTKDELLSVTGMRNDDMTKDMFTKLNYQFSNITGVTIKMANNIYVAKSARVDPYFAEVSRKVFNSEIKNVDFGKKEETASEINEWVEYETNGKIKNIIDALSLDDTIRAVLVNAIYFKGLWKIPFNDLRTKEGDFYVTKDKTVKLPFMHVTDTYTYGESDYLDAKLIEIPFENEETSLLVVLPNKVEGITDLTKKISDPDVLVKAANEMYSAQVSLKLPKFKIDTTTDLEDILQKMGVNAVFDAANQGLNKLLNDENSLFVSKAVQKAFIEINEDGAEAAAANEMTEFSKSGYTEPLLTFEVTHPFYYDLQLGKLSVFKGVYNCK